MSNSVARGRLFRKYVVVLLVLVGGVLMASSLVDLYFSYRETQRAIVRVERAKAVAAAHRIEQLLKEVEHQVRETTRTASDDPDASQVGPGRLGFREGLGAALAQQRELDFVRVLRNVPAVSELSHLDLSGKEQLRVSRLEPDVVGSQADFAQSPKFIEARAGKTYWSPVYFRNDAEPYVTLAVPVGKYALEVTTAEVSLGAVLKAVSQIEVGPGGYAYVVDSRNRLVAHPDSRVLRERRDLSALAQVKSARGDRSGATDDVAAVTVADGFGGGRMLAAHAPIGSLGWMVFVERPAADAYAPLRAPIIRSVIIFVLGLGLSVLASLLLARRMVAPIRVLQAGATRIGAGTLDQPIELRTGDEIEGLAESFNRMAASLKESYEGLEHKVEARTRELADANRDLTEALEQQTATAEILRVISRSPTDLQPVLDAVVKSAARFCAAPDASIFRLERENLRADAHHGPVLQPAGFLVPIVPGTVAGRSVLERRAVSVIDLQAEMEGFPEGSALAKQTGQRATLSVPLLREGAPIGVMLLRRAEAIPFTEKQIELLKTFADQAVIAIENVRLFTELQEKNRVITEALERQTATSEILGVISSSPTDVQPVFDSLVASAARLCGANDVLLLIREGDVLRPVAGVGAFWGSLAGDFRVPLVRGSVAARSVIDGTTLHITDLAVVSEADFSAGRDLQRRFGHRTVLAVPLFREEVALGTIFAMRFEVRPFADQQMALLKTFADQAVIAIENVRLFKELEARTRELSRSVEELRALGEVGRAVSSTLELETVLTTIVSRANQLAGTDSCSVYEYDEQAQHLLLRATHNLPEAVAAVAQRAPIRRGEGVAGRMAVTLQPVQIADIAEPGAYIGPLRDVLLETGTRALLGVPLLREDQLIGGLTVTKKTPGEFSTEVIALLTTFASQSALAIQNARLFREIEEKGRQLELASKHKSQFLANMSHELRTPMNAVLGYTDLILDNIFGDVPEEIRDTLERIKSNGQHLLALINDVLDLSKIEAGQLTLSLGDYSMGDIVQSVVSAVESLAAEKKLALKASVPADLPSGRGDERRITQVLLNLAGNAIKFTDEGEVSIQARRSDGGFLISVSDTGPGIAEADQRRIFEEFQQADSSSTRKKGGTGLGLSISRRIVELHGGRLWVESTVGKGSTFFFVLPVRVER